MFSISARTVLHNANLKIEKGHNIVHTTLLAFIISLVDIEIDTQFR